MANYVVRHAENKDIHPLSLLVYEYIVDFYERPRPSDEKVLQLIRKLLEGEVGIQFVAEQDESLVGFATLYFTYSTTRADKIAIMNDLYVVENVRGKGVAADLFQACDSYRKKHHYASMVWETASSNKRAQSFYKKMGATPEDWITYSLGGN